MRKLSTVVASFATTLIIVSCAVPPEETDADNVGSTSNAVEEFSPNAKNAEEGTEKQTNFPAEPTPEHPSPAPEETEAEEEPEASEEESEEPATENSESEEPEEEVVEIVSFANLDNEIVGMLEIGANKEPGWSGSTESYYDVILSNENLIDSHGNVDRASLSGHIQWVEAESERRAQAEQQRQDEAEARAQQERQQQQAPPPDTSNNDNGSSGGGSSSDSGGGQSAPAPEPEPQPAPAPPSGRAAAENVASSVCGANVTWKNLGPGFLGMYYWGSPGIEITTREGLASSRLQFVAAHECGHIMQHDAFGGDRQAARDSLNPIYGTSGDMGLEHNAECIAFALGHNDTSLGYVPDCSNGAASAVMSGNRP